MFSSFLLSGCMTNTNKEEAEGRIKIPDTITSIGAETQLWTNIFQNESITNNFSLSLSLDASEYEINQEIILLIIITNQVNMTVKLYEPSIEQSTLHINITMPNGSLYHSVGPGWGCMNTPCIELPPKANHTILINLFTMGFSQTYGDIGNAYGEKINGNQTMQFPINKCIEEGTYHCEAIYRPGFNWSRMYVKSNRISFSII